MNLHIIVTVTLASLLMGCQQKPEPAQQKAQVIKNTSMTAEDQEVVYHKEWLLARKMEASELRTNWKVPPAPFTIAEKEFSLENTLVLGLKHLKEIPGIYTPESYLHGRQFESFEETDRARVLARNYRLSVMTAYGILQGGSSPLDTKKLQQTVSEYIFKKDVAREVAYKWAQPIIKTVFKELESADRRDYLLILDHTSQYLGSFNLKREQEYYNSVAAVMPKCRMPEWQQRYYKLPRWMIPDGKYDYLRPCEVLFTQFGPDGKENPFRKIEAFIFRRVTADDWSPVTMKKLVDRLIADLT
ncbi:MAG: hypothetical protein RL292_317 [Candidatus Parcubacteria bacterium]|jgi:hypothetical protein